MDHSEEIIAQVELALSVVKKAEREVRMAKQIVARLRDTLEESTPTAENPHKENHE